MRTVNTLVAILFGLSLAGPVVATEDGNPADAGSLNAHPATTGSDMTGNAESGESKSVKQEKKTKKTRKSKKSKNSKKSKKSKKTAPVKDGTDDTAITDDAAPATP